MTQQEFETHGFAATNKVLFEGEEYFIVSVDFDSGIIELAKENPLFNIIKQRVKASFLFCEIKQQP